MPYIGRPLNAGNLAVQSGTGDGSDTTPIATLDYSVGSSNSIGVYLDGVRQLAGTDFTASGTVLTFTTAPANLVGIDVYFLGLELSIPTPADATVTAAKIASNAVTTAKIASNAVTTAKIINDAVTAPKLDLSLVAGDTIHGTGSDTWARLPKGTDGDVYTLASGIPSWVAGAASLSVKVGQFSMNQATATGTQAVTGVGFEPTSVIFFSNQNVSAQYETSWGLDDGTTALAVATWQPSGAGVFSGTAKSIASFQSGTAYMVGKVNSFDADGFTIGFTKTGSPSGTTSVSYMAFK